MPETPPTAADPPRSAPRSGRSKVILGLGFALVVFVLLLAIVSIFAVPNARNIARDRLIGGVRQAMDASSLPPAEKAASMVIVREFLTRAVAGRIPGDKLDGVFREVMASHYGRLLEILAVQKAIDKSNLGRDDQAAAQEDIRILFDSFVKKQISDAEFAPVVRAIPKDARGQPARQPWREADLRRVLAQADAIGGPYAALCRLAAVARAIGASNLAGKEKAAALDNARVLSEAFSKQRVSREELRPVLDAIPTTGPLKIGEPPVARLPWEKETLDKVLSQIASIGGPAGKLMQIAAVRRAIESSKMAGGEKEKAQKSLKNLSAAYLQGAVSDAEIEPVLKAIPPDPERASPPAFQPALAAAEAALKGKEIKPEAALPDFPDEIRRVVKLMKDASAADAATPKSRT